MLQNKLRKNHTHSISILGYMKEILPNFQWDPPSKTRERDDQTLKSSCCEITFWALRRVSVAIVTNLNFHFCDLGHGLSEHVTYIHVTQSEKRVQTSSKTKF